MVFYLCLLLSFAAVTVKHLAFDHCVTPLMTKHAFLWVKWSNPQTGSFWSHSFVSSWKVPEVVAYLIDWQATGPEDCPTPAHQSLWAFLSAGSACHSVIGLYWVFSVQLDGWSDARLPAAWDPSLTLEIQGWGDGDGGTKLVGIDIIIACQK